MSIPIRFLRILIIGSVIVPPISTAGVVLFSDHKLSLGPERREKLSLTIW